MNLSNIFQNGYPLMYVELMNLYYSMVAHMGDALYCIVRFLRSQTKFGLNLNASNLKVYFGDLYIFNVYMPCNQHIFIHNYIDVLSQITHYCFSHNVQYFFNRR